MGYDYTEAPPQRETELIPHGTVATVSLKIRAGGAGEGGLLKRSAKGDCEMLDLEFTVVDGSYIGRAKDRSRAFARALAREFPGTGRRERRVPEVRSQTQPVG